MHLIAREQIRFAGKHGHDSQCRIDIYATFDRTQTFIIAVHDQYSYGTTITNAASMVHWLGLLLCRDRCLPMRDVLHIECFECSALSPDHPTFDLLLFDENTHQELTQSKMDVAKFLRQSEEGALIPQSVLDSPLPQPAWIHLGRDLTPESLREMANQQRNKARSKTMSSLSPRVHGEDTAVTMHAPAYGAAIQID